MPQVQPSKQHALGASATVRVIIMTRTELQNEALERARTSQALTNYPAIFEGFMAKGIPETDIKPRENVFTFHEGCPPSKAVLEVHYQASIRP
jgi:hypothetical protein